MTDLKYLPVRLVSGDVGSRFVLRVFHLVGEDEQVVFYVCEAGWRRFALRGVADGWHFSRLCKGCGLLFKLQADLPSLRFVGYGFVVRRGACGGVAIPKEISQPWARLNLRFTRDQLGTSPELGGTTTVEASSTE